MPGIEDKNSWNYIKVRILNPSDFKQETFRTKDLKDGISIIIGQLEDGDSSFITQSYRFDKSEGWDIEKVDSWLKENNISFDNETLVDNQDIFENEINCSYASKMSLISCNEQEYLAEIELLREGQWEHPDAPNGLLKITENLIDEFVFNFNNDVVGEKIPLDYNHIDDSEATPGWIVKMEKVVVDDIKKIIATLHITDVSDLPAKKSTWTRVKEGSLQFISPSIALGWKNPADSKVYNVIRAAALTNYPHIKGMDAIKPINFQEVKKFIKNNEEVIGMTLEDIKKQLEAGKISLEDAVKMIKSIVSLEEVSNEEVVSLCSNILTKAEVKLEENSEENSEEGSEEESQVDNEEVNELEKMKTDLEEKDVKIAELEEKLTKAEAIVNNSDDEKVKEIETLTAMKTDLEEKLTSVQESLPKENEVIISKDEFINYLSIKNSLDGKIQETIVSRVIGKTKSEIEKSFNDEHVYFTNLQEMLKTSSSNSTSTPSKKFGDNVDVSKYVEESISSKMK